MLLLPLLALLLLLLLLLLFFFLLLVGYSVMAKELLLCPIIPISSLSVAAVGLISSSSSVLWC